PVYDMSNEEFRKGIAYLKEKGITILGGCCGVDVGHIKAIADLC
ncbi:MAG: homocysteine S-methyltransferase family protein, partial [Firmicutes bacterium]|nr:homocysteine S-methyltransferase family protein [Bacillota bacterium]